MDIATLIVSLICLGLLLRLSYRQHRPHASKQKIVLDTSTLMDGRVIELVRTRFLRGEVLINQRVVAEMQHLADNGTSQKRERARLGLDVLKELQSSPTISIRLVAGDESVPVDDDLRLLAARTHSLLMTNDYNLAKVAMIDGVGVLNINELAQGLRPVRLPGERLDIKIVQKGAEKQQGVGYLEDGTMVVVDRAARRIGYSIPVVITRSLQTSAGKMCFAEPASRAKS